MECDVWRIAYEVQILEYGVWTLKPEVRRMELGASSTYHGVWSTENGRLGMEYGL